jgi:hypothetical protein
VFAVPDQDSLEPEHISVPYFGIYPIADDDYFYTGKLFRNILELFVLILIRLNNMNIGKMPK